MKRTNELNQPIGLPVEGWSSCDSPPKTLMQGQYCRVEPYNADSHNADLFTALTHDGSEKNWTYLPYGPFDNFNDFDQWARTSCNENDPLFHTVVDNRTDLPIGLASFLRITPGVGVIEVGHIHFSPLLQRTPLATEAMFLMMQRVFDELGYRRYEWKCDSLNAPSCRAAERFGFRYEGLFRQATIYKNRNRDTSWFAILDSEWPNVKQAYQQWLAPGNFAENGNQLKSLRELIGRNAITEVL